MPSNLSSTFPEEPTNGSAAHARIQGTLKLMAETIIAMAPPGSSAAENLKKITSGLESAVLPEMIATCNDIADCLPQLREDAIRFRQAAAEVQQPEASDPAIPKDTASGLEGPAAAQQLIAACLRDRRQTFVAVLVLDQLRALNARFGRTVGDEVILLVAQDLNRELEEFGSLFRWRGPAFVVLCSKGQTAADALENRIKSMAAKRLEKTINIENRSIHLKINFSWQLNELNLDQNIDQIGRGLDDFVASRGGRPGQ